MKRPRPRKLNLKVFKGRPRFEEKLADQVDNGLREEAVRREREAEIVRVMGELDVSRESAEEIVDERNNVGIDFDDEDD